MIEPPTDAHAAFDQFVALAHTIADGGAMARSHAVIWSQARDALLASHYRDRLPGFIFQCLSVFKFRDFITLYHPDPRQRRAFLDHLLDSARQVRRPSSAAPPTAARPVPNRELREWML